MEDIPIFRNYLEDEDDKPYYTKNSLAYYYDDMERKEKLIKEMAKYIAGYSETLTLTTEEIEKRVADKFKQWDQTIQKFPDNVTDLLTEWTEDGTLNHIIDNSLIEQKVAPLTAQLAETGISVKNYGASGDGSISNTAIKNALAYAHTTGAKTVRFPKGIYKITEQIVVENGINLIAEKGAKLIRGHVYTAGYASFFLKGNNKISGFEYDGGSDAIQVVGTDYVNYCDFFCQGNNITITEMKFDKSCGSFIVTGDYSNQQFYDNAYGDYKDHCVYIGGRVGNGNSELIRVTESSFLSLTSTRDAVKVRNGAYDLSVSNNLLKLPSAKFFTFDIGDPSGDKPSDKINIKNNIGTCDTFITSLNKGVQISDHVDVADNNVNCLNYVALLGLFPKSTEQSGTSIGIMNFTDNTFVSQNGFVINGELAKGIDHLLFKDNHLTLKAPGRSMFNIIGKLANLELKDNTFKGDFPLNTSSAVVSVVHTNEFAFTYKSPTVGNIFFEDNKVDGGIHSLIHENSTDKPSSLVNWNVHTENNKFLADVNTKIAYVIGTHQTAIIGTLYQKDNLSLKNKMQPTDWNPSKIVYRDMKPILNKTYAYAGTTLGASTPLNIDIPIVGITANDRVIVNAQYGAIAPDLIMKAICSTDSVRIQLYNPTATAKTIGALTFLISIVKSDSGTPI